MESHLFHESYSQERVQDISIDEDELMETDTSAQSDSDSGLGDTADTRWFSTFMLNILITYKTRGLLISSSSEAVRGMEDMVISFLSQLAFFGRTTSHACSNSGSTSESDSNIEANPRTHRNKSKIELQLVDRTKERYPE